MAWTGLVLTVDGQNALNNAQLSGRMQIKSIVIGDGATPANFRTLKSLVNQLYEVTDLMVEKTDAGCTLTVEVPRVDYDYYFREIGVVVSTDDGDKLYVYDNCGDDAQYIVSTTGVETTKKRLRISLSISDVAEVTVASPSLLYVAYDDFNGAVEQLKEEISSMAPSVMVGATESSPGKAGLVPPPAAGQQMMVLNAAGEWSFRDQVRQIPKSDNVDHRILMSLSGDDNDRTEHAAKAAGFTYNPSTKTLTAENIIGHLQFLEWDISKWPTIADAPTGLYRIRADYTVQLPDRPADASGCMYLLKSDKFDDKFMAAWEARSKKMWVNYYYGDTSGWQGWNNIYTAASPQPYIPLANDQSIPVSIRSQTVSNDATDYMLAWISVSNGSARELRPIASADVRRMISALGLVKGAASGSTDYYGMRLPDGTDQWIRTPTDGLLPCMPGNAGSGHSYLGTSSWYFAGVYADRLYGSADMVTGVYTSGGGAQPPSYVPSGKARFNMMNQLKGLTAIGYCDILLMDTYTGSDVPYVTALMLRKDATPRAWIATGAKGNTTTWAAQAELITSQNIASQTAAAATKATQDGNGNNIANTYLPKSGGTMTGAVSMGSNAINIGGQGMSISNGGYNYNILLKGPRNALYFNDSDTVSGAPFFAPTWTGGGAGKVNLGLSTYPWKQVYASASTISTSDRAKKKDIEMLSDDLITEFIMGLIPSSYKFIDNESGRTHYGMIAQDVEELMEAAGMTSKDFAGFIKSPKTREVEVEEEVAVEKDVEVADENGTVHTEKQTVKEIQKRVEHEIIEGEYDYGLRYEEFIAPTIKFTQILYKQNQEQQEQIDQLEAENRELKDRLARIEKIIGISS